MAHLRVIINYAREINMGIMLKYNRVKSQMLNTKP